MCEFAVDPGLPDLDLRNRVGRNLEGIRAQCYADDVDIDLESMGGWSEARARAYFEAGGVDEGGDATDEEEEEEEEREEEEEPAPPSGDDDDDEEEEPPPPPSGDEEGEEDEVRPPSEPPPDSEDDDAMPGPAAPAGAVPTHAPVHDDETDRGRAPSVSEDDDDDEPPPPLSDDEEEEGGGDGARAEALVAAVLRRDSQGRFKIMVGEDEGGLYLKNMGDVDVDDDRGRLQVHDYLHSVDGLDASQLSLAAARDLIKSAEGDLELCVALAEGDPRRKPRPEAAPPSAAVGARGRTRPGAGTASETPAPAPSAPFEPASSSGFGASFDVSFDDAFAALPPSAFGEGTPFGPAPCEPSPAAPAAAHAAVSNGFASGEPTADRPRAGAAATASPLADGPLQDAAEATFVQLRDLCAASQEARAELGATCEEQRVALRKLTAEIERLSAEVARVTEAAEASNRRAASAEAAREVAEALAEVKAAEAAEAAAAAATALKAMTATSSSGGGDKGGGDKGGGVKGGVGVEEAEHARLVERHEELSERLRTVESEAAAKDGQLRTLQDELAALRDAAPPATAPPSAGGNEDGDGDERLRVSEAREASLTSKLAEAEDALARSRHECQELRGHVEAVLTSAAKVHAEKAGPAAPE